ncbi:MAG: glycoside hydrolase family 16 protein [Segetibacter sp.]|nr:glycoside hydrolase family 16 protein [Segetibacter sp.]
MYNGKQFAIIFFVLASKAVIAQKTDFYKPDFGAPKAIPGYTLAWNDEFNTNGKPDETSWKYEKGFVRNQELQWYQQDNANCINGVLLIEGRREKIKNPAYNAGSLNWKLNREYSRFTSASIQTKGLKQWKYGRFEIRARIDTSLGSWPAIWTLGINGSWPSNGEIDIMEFYRVKDEPTILANVAWGTSRPYVARWHTETRPLLNFIRDDPDWVKKFHTWRMDWSKESINLYLDNQLLNTTVLDTTLNADNSNPFLQPHFLLLNLAIGGNGGEPRETGSPITYEVDYVRVYQKK